jgi:hypothetical protein
MQRSFWKAMRDPAPPADLLARIGFETPGGSQAPRDGAPPGDARPHPARIPRGDARFLALDRLLVYRRAYWARQIEALRDEYRRLAARIGPDGFADLMHEYLLAHPSRDPRIEWLGRELPSFLRGHPSDDRRRLADLAALEWAEVEALLAEDPPAIATPLDVPAALFPACRLAMVPALRVLALSSDPEPGGVPSPAVFAVWRQGFSVRHRRVESDEQQAAIAALAGESVAVVCEAFCAGADPAQRASAVLSTWLADQWISRIVPPSEDAIR